MGAVERELNPIGRPGASKRKPRSRTSLQIKAGQNRNVEKRNKGKNVSIKNGEKIAKRRTKHKFVVKDGGGRRQGLIRDQQQQKGT